MAHKKSDEDKKISGTYRAGDKKHFGEPLTILPKPPFELTKEGVRIYAQEGVALIEQGILKPSDVRLLAAYANEMSIYIEQSALAQETGVVIELPNGISCTSAHRRAAEQAYKLASAMADKLGLSAIGRSRLGIKNTEPPKPDPFAEFLSSN